MVVESLVVFVSQLTMVFLRLLNVRAISNHNVSLSVLLTGGVQISWLVASALGIRAIYEQNVTIVIFYILGGMVGAYFSFYIKLKDKA